MAIQQEVDENRNGLLRLRLDSWRGDLGNVKVLNLERRFLPLFRVHELLLLLFSHIN